MKNIVNFSGGKDSTCLLLMMLEKGMQVDDIIFCDTGMEYPEMYKHIEKVEKYIGRKITRLTGEHSFSYFVTEQKRKKKRNEKECGYGFPRVWSRWCTKSLKVTPAKEYIKAKYPGEQVQQYIGIAADEPKRIKSERYPLVDWGITEADALKYCYSKGFDWDGLYKHLSRVSCFCCPLQTLNETRYLYRERPELWKNIVVMEKAITLTDCDQMLYKPRGQGCEYFKIRFALEDKYKAAGESITSTKFYKELREATAKE